MSTRIASDSVQRCCQQFASVVEVNTQRLAEMLPPAGVSMQHKPMRLCGAFYGESLRKRGDAIALEFDNAINSPQLSSWKYQN